MNKTLKRTLLTIVIAILVCMLDIPIVNAASSSITGSKTITVGESVTISASVNAGAWNVVLSGNGQTKELVGQTATQGNSSASTSITFTPNKEGTYTFTLTGDITDYTTEATETINKTCTITVKAKESSGGNSGSESNTGSGSNSGSNNNSSSGNSGNSGNTTSAPSFTSVNETVYATGSVNVRKSWSTSSEVVGSLSEGQSITRTGKGDNGWSRVTFNGSTAYVSSQYLTAEKPEEKSKNSALKELSLLQGTLTPEFSKDVTEYSVQVGTDITELQLDAIPEDEKAKVTVEGNTDLKDGENKVTITVTAEDGSKTTYTLTVNKTDKEAIGLLLNKLEIAGVTLTPTFTPEVYSYSANVPTGTTTLDITAITDEEGATVEITGNTDLKDGENLITIMVKKSDGEEQQITTYQINVNVGEQAVATTKEENSGPNILIIICGIAAAIIVIAIITLIVISRRNRMEYDDDEDDYENTTILNQNFNYADELKARKEEKNEEKKQSREEYLNSYQDILGSNTDNATDEENDTERKKRKGRHF